MNNEQATLRCNGKPIPKTYDAMYLLGHYKDPRIVMKGITSILSATLIAGILALQFLYFFN